MKPNPHTNPVVLARVLGYDVQDAYGALADITAEGLRAALLGALARNWPAGPVDTPGDVYEGCCGTSAPDVGQAIGADRGEGRIPLLIAVELQEPAEAAECLRKLYEVASREGVWLHADCVARHGVTFERLAYADSVAFNVPGGGKGRRRVFATRHPRVLDDEFRLALGEAE